MKSFSSRELMQQLVNDGWYIVACVGDHHQFKHPKKTGRVTLPTQLKMSQSVQLKV